MTTIKTLSGLLVAVVAAIVAAVALGAAQASASSAPIVITYEKTCNEIIGHCEDYVGGTIKMDVTGFRATGGAFQLTMNEEINLGGGIWFKAELSGHRSPAGFIVLNGTVTDGVFVGAHVHQRSEYVSGPVTASEWVGELQLVSAGA
jgi:hypothetical protein